MTAQDQLDGQTRHRLTVEDFLLLDEAGAFGTRSTELLDGEVYYMNAKHLPHATAIGEMYFLLRQSLSALDNGLEAIIDVSVRASDHDVPEPDIVIANRPSGDGILPVEAVRLVIEVSHSTLNTDLGVKADLYARVGIPEYWVVDLNENRILAHASPRPDGSGYDGPLDMPFGDILHSATIEGLSVETATLG